MIQGLLLSHDNCYIITSVGLKGDKLGGVDDTEWHCVEYSLPHISTVTEIQDICSSFFGLWSFFFFKSLVSCKCFRKCNTMFLYACDLIKMGGDDSQQTD